VGCAEAFIGGSNFEENYDVRGEDFHNSRLRDRIQADFADDMYLMLSRYDERYSLRPSRISLLAR